MLLMYIKYHPAICKKTAHGLTMSFVERFRELGGELWLNTKALEVTADENGKITGVETTAGFVETNYVIANVNPQTAYTKLLSKNIKVPERELKRVSAEKHGVRFFNAYVGLNKSCEELGIKDYTIFMPGSFDTNVNYACSKKYEGNPYGTIVIYNIVNPEASPPGTTVLTFTCAYTEDVWGGFSQKEYVKRKQETFRAVLKNFEDATGIIIHDCIEEIEIATPWTFCNFLGTPQGTVYGFETSEWDTMVSRLMSLKKDQPIHGFKTCGASGARGDGFNQTYLNGDDMATLILMDMAEDEKEAK
jgi:prolycopene isomerase